MPTTYTGHLENGFGGAYDLTRPGTHSDHGETWVEVPAQEHGRPKLPD